MKRFATAAISGCWRTGLGVLVVALAVATWGRAEERTPDDAPPKETSAAALLPTTTVAYAEVADPASVVEGVLGHPLYGKVNSLDAVKAAYEQKQFKDFQNGVRLFEAQIGMPWREAIAKTAGKGVVLAVDGETQGAVLILSAVDEASQAKLLEALSNLTRLTAVMSGKEKPAELGDYRGIKGYKFNGAIVGLLGHRLVVCNNEALAKKVVDAHLDAPAENFALSPLLASARARAEGAAAFAVVDVAKVREAGLAKEVLGGKAENPAAELLFGGLLSTLHQTPYAVLAVRTVEGGLQGELTMPHDRNWAGDERGYFFGEGGVGAAPPSAAPPGTIFSLRAHRDIAGMWMRAGDLFNEKINEEMAKAESGISNLLAGKDFAEDLLGAFGPAVEIVVAQREFAAGAPTPAIKLPGFAAVFELKDPEAATPDLRRNFQNAIGFFNIVGGMNGQPQFELEMEKRGDGQIVSAKCVEDPRKLADAAAIPIQYNFTPTAAFVGKRFVLASTKELAESLLAAPGETSAATEVTNTAAALAGKALQNVLEANREQLIVQNMLEEGRSREEAEAAISVLLEIVGWFESASAALSTTDETLSLKLDVKLDPTLASENR